jgi:broad specificity phosphatase PhoE
MDVGSGVAGRKCRQMRASHKRRSRPGRTYHSTPVQTRVLLIRHADVENPKRVLYGHLPGFGLSALGRAQAVAVGQSLRDAGITRIVHSPLQRAVETAEIINGQLPSPVPMETEPALREAEFSRYLQGVPYWQIPVRRPLWVVHKARRGMLPGDESVNVMGNRVLETARRLVHDHPGEVIACVSHADPLQAAWVLLDGRSHNEREMYRKPVDRAGILSLTFDGADVAAIEYIAPPKIARPAPAPQAG